MAHSSNNKPSCRNTRYFPYCAPAQVRLLLESHTKLQVLHFTRQGWSYNCNFDTNWSPHVLLPMYEICYLLCRHKCTACGSCLAKLHTSTWWFNNDCCFWDAPLNPNGQMFPNAENALLPTLNCLHFQNAKRKKKEKGNSQKVGFLEVRVDSKAWNWSLTLIGGCTAGSPKVMLGREGDVYKLNKFTDSSCIKRRCWDTRCWNKGGENPEV